MKGARCLFLAPDRRFAAVMAIDQWGRHHEVSIQISPGAGVGRCLGSQPRAKVSMTIIRLRQHGHGRGSTRGWPWRR